LNAQPFSHHQYIYTHSISGSTFLRGSIIGKQHLLLEYFGKVFLESMMTLLPSALLASLLLEVGHSCCACVYKNKHIPSQCLQYPPWANMWQFVPILPTPSSTACAKRTGPGLRRIAIQHRRQQPSSTRHSSPLWDTTTRWNIFGCQQCVQFQLFALTLKSDKIKLSKTSEAVTSLC